MNSATANTWHRAFATFLCFVLLLSSSVACKPRLASSGLQSEGSVACQDGSACRDISAVVWVAQKLPDEASKVLAVLNGKVAGITDLELHAFLDPATKSPAYQSTYLAWSVDFRQPFNKPVVTPHREDAAGTSFVSPTWYKGLALGPWIYILSSTLSVPEDRWYPNDPVSSHPRALDGIWKYAGRFSRNIRENGVIPDKQARWDVSANITDKTMFIVDAKFTGPAALNRVREGIELLEATAGFIPGYAGAEDLVYGSDTWQKGYGLVMVAADLLPMAGKLKDISNIVRAEANSFVLIGATARMGKAAKAALDGKASNANVVNGVFAFVETAVYVLSRVPIKVRIRADVPLSDTAHLILAVEEAAPNPVIAVEGAEGIERMARALGVEPKDVARGISSEQLLSVIDTNPAAVRTEVQALRTAWKGAANEVSTPAMMAENLIAERRAAGRPIEIDIGGEGAHPDAININPASVTSTTGAAGRPIPNLVPGKAESVPMPDHVVDSIFVENAPLKKEAIAEIKRLIKPGGTVILTHPSDYAETIYPQIIDVLGGRHDQQTSGIMTTLTITVPP